MGEANTQSTRAPAQDSPIQPLQTPLETQSVTAPSVPPGENRIYFISIQLADIWPEDMQQAMNDLTGMVSMISLRDPQSLTPEDLDPDIRAWVTFPSPSEGSRATTFPQPSRNPYATT